MGFSNVEARRRFFDCCGVSALGAFLGVSSGEVGESGVYFDGDDNGDEETSYGGFEGGAEDDAIDPKAGGGSVNASSRDDKFGGGFGGRSTEDWGVGGRIG